MSLNDITVKTVDLATAAVVDLVLIENDEFYSRFRLSGVLKMQKYRRYK